MIGQIRGERRKKKRRRNGKYTIIERTYHTIHSTVISPVSPIHLLSLTHLFRGQHDPHQVDRLGGEFDGVC
jgi:hypothetical protein